MKEKIQRHPCQNCFHLSTATIDWLLVPVLQLGFPGGSVVKNPPANAEDMGSIPGSGRAPGGGKGNRLQHSCLGNPMDRGTWWATVHGVTKSQT